MIRRPQVHGIIEPTVVFDHDVGAILENFDISDGNLPVPSGLPEFTEEYSANSYDPNYSPFIDPDSPFYGLSADWRPNSNRPVPTVRCSRIKKDGEQCKNRGIRGLGLTVGNPSFCRKHGGSLPNLRKHADGVVEAARLQLLDSAPDAIQTIYNLMVGSRTADNVKLAAAKEVLDRAGVKGTVEVQIEITNNVPASEKILKKLESMRSKEDTPLEEPPLEDLGEAVVEPESE